MARVRFVHAADLHLDSPFKGLRAVAPDNVANALYGATFKAYENIIELCISERVDALLVAGDVYDGADRSLRAQRKFVEGMERLHSAGIRSFVCHGNHDPLDGWEARLAYPQSCTRFGAEFKAVPVFDDDLARAVVHGVSYPTRDVTESLIPGLNSVDADTFSIGLMHANVDNNPDHDRYAPCTLNDLVQSDVNYWALGHVHTRKVLSEREPTVVYPGNPQGRHLDEPGPRGVYLVNVEDGGNISLDFRSMDTIRWERCTVDIGAFETEQEVLDTLHDEMQSLLDAAEGRPVIAGITLSGRGEVNQFLRQPNAASDLVEEINDVWASRSPFVWCARIEDASAPAFDRDARLAGSDFLAEVLRAAAQGKTDPELLERLRSGLSDLHQHHRYRRYVSDAAPSQEELASLIDEAESMTVNLLTEDDV